MFARLILAEASNFHDLVNGLKLLMSTTALPALVGLLILFCNHFRAPGARAAFCFGLLTVLLVGGLWGWLGWMGGLMAVEAWFGVLGPCLLAGLVVCALAWQAMGRLRE